MDLSDLRVPPHPTRPHANCAQPGNHYVLRAAEVVGEVTSSVTATGVPEVYGCLRRAGTT